MGTNIWTVHISVLMRSYSCDYTGSTTEPHERACCEAKITVFHVSLLMSSFYECEQTGSTTEPHEHTCCDRNSKVERIRACMHTNMGHAVLSQRACS